MFSTGQFEHFRNRESVFKEYRPYFEHEGKNVTAVVGETIHLDCGVRNLGDRYVSENYTDTVGLPDSPRHTVHSMYPAAAAITAGILLVGRSRTGICLSLPL